jgi:hypothetical protein
MDAEGEGGAACATASAGVAGVVVDILALGLLSGRPGRRERGGKEGEFPTGDWAKVPAFRGFGFKAGAAAEFRGFFRGEARMSAVSLPPSGRGVFALRPVGVVELPSPPAPSAIVPFLLCSTRMGNQQTRGNINITEQQSRHMTREITTWQGNVGGMPHLICG